MTLAEFIQDCLRQRDEKRAREEADKTREREDLDRLRNTVLAAAIEIIQEAIPEPLRAFISYDGDEPTEGQLRAYPDRWFPFAFKVEAPGLAPIHFITTTAEGASQVTAITVGPDKFGVDWIEAVAAAVIPEEETEVKR